MYYKVDKEFNEDHLNYNAIIDGDVARLKEIAEEEVAQSATDLSKKHITLNLVESKRGYKSVQGSFVILSGESWIAIKAKIQMLHEIARMSGNGDVFKEIIHNIEKEV